MNVGAVDMVRSRCERCIFHARPLFAPPCNACRLMPVGADCYIGLSEYNDWEEVTNAT